MRSGKIRLKYVDMIRFFAVCLIVISHFNGALSSAEISIWGKIYLIKSEFANFSFGTLGVSLFFIISGLSLFYNYEDNFQIKQFYKKRFEGIYPTFWCSYFLVFLFLFFQHKGFWFGSVPKWKAALTVLGIDGYFRYLGDNFYLIGEWFLGCIIIFYLLFPFLRMCVNKHPAITIIIAIICYILTAVFNPFMVGVSRNIIIRLCDFLLGMYWAKYMKNKQISSAVFIISIICLILCGFVGEVKYPVFLVSSSGILLFLLLAFLFERFDVSQAYFIRLVGKYSYEIFLLHHVCISLYLGSFKGHQYSLYGGIILLIGVILVIWLTIVFEKLTERELGKVILGFVQRKEK